MNPQVGDGEGRIVTFRDGPQLMPQAFAQLADADAYPTLTYQQWIKEFANRKIEAQVVGQAISQARTGHFAQ